MFAIMIRVEIAKDSLAKRVLFILIGISLVVFSLHIIMEYINISVYDQKHGAIFEISNRFNLNDENSVPQWFSQLFMLTAGLLAFLSYKLTTKVEGALVWLFMSIIGLVMAIDDVATLHETVLQILHITFLGEKSSSVTTNAWLMLLPFILAGSAGIIYWASKKLPARTTARLSIGVLVFIFGAVVMDSFVNFYPEQSFMGKGVLSGLEGLFQLLGSSVVVYAIVDYLEMNFKKPLKEITLIIRPYKRSNNNLIKKSYD